MPHYGEIGAHLAENLHRCDKNWDSEIFHQRAGLTNYTNAEDVGNNRPNDRPPPQPSAGRCVFDLDNDYGVKAGAGLVAPLALLVAMSMLLTTTDM